jgi:hypothetical protein
MAHSDAASMTGGIMPKLYAVRWPIGILVVVLLIAGISFAPAGLRPSWLTSRLAWAIGLGEPDEFAGERGALLFFKAALGRIDDELRHRGDGATPSLRGERDAVLQRMREVAIRVPADRLPADVAGLLQTATAAAEPVVRPVGPAIPAPQVRALQTGLGARQAAIDFSSLVFDPPPPLPVYIARPARRAEHARDADAAGDKTADKPAKERPAKDKERASAEPAASEQPAKDRPLKDRPAAERTTVADHAERRQPAR